MPFDEDPRDGIPYDKESYEEWERSQQKKVQVTWNVVDEQKLRAAYARLSESDPQAFPPVLDGGVEQVARYVAVNIDTYCHRFTKVPLGSWGDVGLELTK
jgi:hypothetical protein